MITFRGLLHILPCVIIYTAVKNKHLYPVSEYSIPAFALNTVHGQKQSERLVERKSSLKHIVLFAEWGIAYKNIPFLGFVCKEILTLFQTAPYHRISFLGEKPIICAPFFIERTPYNLVFGQKLR